MYFIVIIESCAV